MRLNTILKTGFGLLLCAALPQPLLAADSDLLIVVGQNGKQYIAQHTLTTERELLLLNLPLNRSDLHVQFSGPEKLTFLTAYEKNRSVVSLWSGAAMIRYRHQYNDGVEVLDDGTIKIDVSREHFPVNSEDPSKLRSSVTWILPEAATLISWSNQNNDPNIHGSWKNSEDTVSYKQPNGPLPDLSLRFRLYAEEPEIIIDPCVAVVTPTDECSPDIDQDNIPDYRDVCLAEIDDNSAPATIDQLGCNGQLTITLDGIHFEVGKSYLNAASRAVLDRTAIALQRIPDQLYEVAAHTDNAGSDSNNLRLSESRSTTVRHYLMLRGVGPNQLTTAGYGERSPIASNSTITGRKNNRRIELKALN